MKYDQETTQVLREGSDRADFVKSTEWQKVKKELLQSLSNLDTVKGLKGKQPEEIIREIEVREQVISIILDWIDGIEGIANQTKGNKELLQEVSKDDYIVRTE